MMTIIGRALIIILLWIFAIPSFGNGIVQGCWTLQSSRPSAYSPNDGFGIMCNDCPHIYFGNNGKGVYCYGNEGFSFSWEYSQGFLSISSNESFLGISGNQKFQVFITKTNTNQRMDLYRKHKDDDKTDIFSFTNDELNISFSKKMHDEVYSTNGMELAILEEIVPNNVYISEDDTLYMVKGDVKNNTLFVESDSITLSLDGRVVLHKVPDFKSNKTLHFFVFNIEERVVWEIVTSFNECSNSVFYRINQEWRLSKPSLYSCSSNNDIYWEEIKDINKETVLGSSQISHDAKMAYKGTFMFSDNEETEKLLDELTTISKDAQINAFRFFLLNRILASSDGALMELCDEYAYSYMKRNTNYVLNYIAHNDTICQLYVNCISAELYFEELNIEDFERTVSPKVNENNRAMYKTFLQKVREKRVF